MLLVVRRWWWLALVATAGFGPVAAAQEAPEGRVAEARALFEAGRHAFEAGRYEEALGHFRRAHELSARPRLLYNIGAAADRLRRNEVALAYFRRFLSEAPDTDLRPAVEARIEVLEREVDREAEVERERRRRRELEQQLEEERARRERAQRAGGGVETEWWFWTLIGALLVGGAVTGIVLATTLDSGPALITGDNGVTFTLTGP